MSSITAQLPFERLQYALNNTVALLWCSMAASEAKLVIGDQTGLLQYCQFWRINIVYTKLLSFYKVIHFQLLV